MAYLADRAFELISAAHERGRLAHAFLISGAHGSGKERLAARVIQLVNGAAAGGGFDLFGEPVVVETPPLDDLENGWVRNDQAANAFLKTLEEPPRNTLLLLLTANPQRLLPTVLSRCTRLPLLGGDPLLAHGGAELVSALNRVAARGFGTPIAALHLKAAFTSFLAEYRAEADASAKAAEKEEVAAYRDSTDGRWLKEREDFHKAAAEAEYLDSRNRLFDVLMAWMADLLRMKVNAGGLDFPASAPALQAIAAAETEGRLLKRMEALDALRRTLETNAFEPLAIEVGFLKAFG